jgi:hypothetical protein
VGAVSNRDDRILLAVSNTYNPLVHFIIFYMMSNRSEYMNLFNKSHLMIVYSLTSDTKYGLCLCFNYKILGVPDIILCNPPSGAVSID